MHSGRAIACDIGDLELFEFQEIIKARLNLASHIFILMLYEVHIVSKRP